MTTWTNLCGCGHSHLMCIIILYYTIKSSACYILLPHIIISLFVPFKLISWLDHSLGYSWLLFLRTLYIGVQNHHFSNDKNPLAIQFQFPIFALMNVKDPLDPLLEFFPFLKNINFLPKYINETNFFFW